MESDILAAGLASLPGFIFIAFMTLLTGIPWRIILSKKFQVIGWIPLVFGYFFALAGTACLALAYANFEVLGNVVIEQPAISIRVLYSGVNFFAISLPIIGIIAVPVMAYMARR